MFLYDCCIPYAWTLKATLFNSIVKKEMVKIDKRSFNKPHERLEIEDIVQR